MSESELIPAGQGLECLPARPTYEQIRRLQAVMATMPQVECQLEHHFAHGVYGRLMHAKAGTVIVGKVHRFSTLNILLAGVIRVTGPDGAVRDMRAPCVFVSPPGCKKVGAVIEDVQWMNVFATKLTDVAAIETQFTLPETPLIESAP
ncbi:hypothetical protein CSC62_05480 [Pseudoxanthomonas jiangsuensis]|uniref:hypothetical protein n=1 Tax=Pseudoxanthomonas jiangsuensis TaxID=619688 RepID=UPI001391BB1E|nr:hypothetical protein [Pseudoxanthomonas jiangsuensis]KAF1698360.1 hypothetical protein CSC62_05480 [Pseudoxanthomonas jiangsuensis]